MSVIGKSQKNNRQSVKNKEILFFISRDFRPNNSVFVTNNSTPP